LDYYKGIFRHFKFHTSIQTKIPATL